MGRGRLTFLQGGAPSPSPANIKTTTGMQCTLFSGSADIIKRKSRVAVCDWRSLKVSLVAHMVMHVNLMACCVEAAANITVVIACGGYAQYGNCVTQTRLA